MEKDRLDVVGLNGLNVARKNNVESEFKRYRIRVISQLCLHPLKVSALSHHMFSTFWKYRTGSHTPQSMGLDGA